MKIFAFLLLLTLPIQWESSFDQAKQTAREKHQLILLNFSGSDWCAPCMLMRKEYLDDAGFLQMAHDNLVLVNADFPRRKKNLGTADQIKNNEWLAEHYNKDGAFPMTLLLDADGNVVKSWRGKPQAGVSDWTAEIKALCTQHK